MLRKNYSWLLFCCQSPWSLAFVLLVSLLLLGSLGCQAGGATQKMVMETNGNTVHIEVNVLPIR